MGFIYILLMASLEPIVFLSSVYLQERDSSQINPSFLQPLISEMFSNWGLRESYI